MREDVCISIDSRPQAEEKLLQFLMDDFFIPQEIWQVLDSAFHWTERVPELYEHYPRDFVDYAVLDGIRTAPTMPYPLFVPGKDGRVCDDYRRLYYRALSQSGEELAQTLDQLTSLPEYHPYADMVRCRLWRDTPRAGEIPNVLQSLAERYPDDSVLTMAWANECTLLERWDEAETLFRKVTEMGQTRSRGEASRMLAQCLSKLDRLEDAKDIYFDLMHAAGGDQKDIYHLSQAVTAINETLIARLEQSLQEMPGQQDTMLKLGWCYLQNDLFDKAEAIRAALSPDAHAPYDYQLFSSKVFYARQEWEQSLAALTALEQMLRALPTDCQGDDRKHLNRLPEFLQIQGSCLLLLHRDDEAIPKYEEAVSLSPDDGEIITRTGHVYFSRKEYEKARQMAQKLVDLMPQSYHSHYLLSQVLFELRRDQEAFNAINRALDLDRTDLGVYVLKMRILLRNDAYDEVLNILDFLAANNITDELSVLWCRAQVTEFHEKNNEEALKQYQTIATRMEQEGPLAWGAQVYLRITVLIADKLDARKAEDRAEMIATLDKGLAIDENDFDCMEFKARLLKRDDRLDEAKNLYLKLEKHPHGIGIEQALADIYMELGGMENTAKALHYYEQLIQYAENAKNLFWAGACCTFLRLWNKGETYFLRLQEFDPDDTDGYIGLSNLYEFAGRSEEALHQIEKSIDLMERCGKGEMKDTCLRKVRLLRRLGRWKEAVDTVYELNNRYGYEEYNRTIFDIYCQFGQWDMARSHLKKWKRTHLQSNERLYCEIRLKLLTGDITGAKAKHLFNRSYLSVSSNYTLHETIAMLEDNLPASLHIWHKRRESNPKSTYILMNLAVRHAWQGQLEEARTYASQALELLDDLIVSQISHEANFRCRRAMVLAILGRMADARSELEIVRSLPLCKDCEYMSCKDADLIEAFIEEVSIHYYYAEHLYNNGIDRWPDELDFVAGRKRVERKENQL